MSKKRVLVFPALSRKLAESAWRKPGTRHSPMDVRLVVAFADILDKEMSKPNLGCATTKQLLDELYARSNLGYSTVFYGEQPKPPQAAVI